MSQETFSEQVRRRREDLHLSQTQFAALVDITRETVSKIERGYGTRPSIERRILRALDAAENEGGNARTELAVPSVRESIARTLDVLATAIPEDLFPADSATPEAMAMRATRRAYQHAARIARGEDL